MGAFDTVRLKHVRSMHTHLQQRVQRELEYQIEKADSYLESQHR
jgi:hypothetical protein